jgi:hypothetical protein
MMSTSSMRGRLRQRGSPEIRLLNTGTQQCSDDADTNGNQQASLDLTACQEKSANISTGGAVTGWFGFRVPHGAGLRRPAGFAAVRR